MANILQKLLTMGEGKQLRVYEGRVVRINEIEPIRSRRSATASSRARPSSSASASSTARRSTTSCPRRSRSPARRSMRALGMRHFDVQLIGGMVLNDGMIAEMKTGEGKTLVVDARRLPQRAAGQRRARRHRQRLPGQARLGVDGPHLPLPRHGRRARSSRRWSPSQRIPAYRADVTYGTNAEFGFDYLRDNMVTRPDDRVQRGHAYAIVDEVDSILIDEARTPLIISGAGTKSAETYKQFAQGRSAPAARRRLRARRGQAHDRRHRRRPAQRSRACSASRTSTRDPSGQLVNHLQQALKARVPLQARRRLRGQGRRGPHRRRVHRPPHGTAAATRRACTRPSRPRSACTSARRTRRSPPSRCRTTSASTRSSPA